MTRRIEILAYPDVQILDVTGPLQVFVSANEKVQANGQAAPYRITVVGREPMVRTSSGLAIVAAPLPPIDHVLNTLLVPGGWGVDDACGDAELVDWLTQRLTVAERIASVCSGALLLAKTEVLDGRRAATHWARCGTLAMRHPDIVVDPESIFVKDGPIWTSAGVTAGIDLALALVEEDLGHAVALAVARQLVVFIKRPGTQSQYSTILTLQDSTKRFDELHAWMQANLDRNLSVDALANRAKMSVRSFSRLYQQDTGMTPAKAVEALRIETARRLLEQGRRISDVVRRCGFGSEETMRRAFIRTLNVNPQDYRSRFSRQRTL